MKILSRNIERTVTMEMKRGDVRMSSKVGWIDMVVKIIPSTSGPVDLTDDRLLEDGSFRLLENGDKLLLG